MSPLDEARRPEIRKKYVSCPHEIVNSVFAISWLLSIYLMDGERWPNVARARRARPRRKNNSTEETN